MNNQDSLYVKILLWAHDKQDSGFTLEKLREEFKLNDSQYEWVRKIFLTTSDGDRKYFELLRIDDSSRPAVRYHSLNEKGMTAAISYRGLAHAERSSTQAIAFAGISMLLGAMGLFLQYKQTSLTEVQSIGDRIEQARSKKSAMEFCTQNPEALESGLYNVANGEPAPCKQILGSEISSEPLLKMFETILHQERI